MPISGTPASARVAAALRAPVPTARAVERKGRHILRRVPRSVRRAAASPVDYLQTPPIVVNSFPKSGTHLLWQIAGALPRVRDYGSFVASAPSIRHRTRPDSDLERRLQAIAPGELVRAHLWHGEAAIRRLAEKNAAHIFLYRDPRDVVVSEAHYLAEMAPWHALHPYFARLPEFESRILLSINGLPGLDEGVWYPDVARRFEPYAGWLSEPEVLSLRFEDVLADRDECADRVATAYGRRSLDGVDEVAFRARLRRGVAPERSHTFRTGTSGGWRECFTAEHREAMKRVGGKLLIRLGYESGEDW